MGSREALEWNWHFWDYDQIVLQQGNEFLCSFLRCDLYSGATYTQANYQLYTQFEITRIQPPGQLKAFELFQ